MSHGGQPKTNRKSTPDVIEIKTKARSQTPILIDDTTNPVAIDADDPSIMPKQNQGTAIISTRRTGLAGKRKDVIVVPSPTVLQGIPKKQKSNQKDQVHIIDNKIEGDVADNVNEEDQVSILEEFNKKRSKGKGKLDQKQSALDADGSSPVIIKTVTKPRRKGTSRTTAARRNLISEETSILTSDEEYARRLQEEEYQAMNGLTYQERYRNIQSVLDPYPFRINGTAQLRLRVLQEQLQDLRGLGIEMDYESLYQEQDDVDQMSYEQLWALGERIGDVKSKRLPKSIQERLPIKEFSKQASNKDDME